MSRSRAAALAAGALALASSAVVAGPADAGPDGQPGARQELSFQDPEIDESSGLVVQGRDVLTVNDSGGEPVVYVVDAGTGATVGRTTYASEAFDVEALAPGLDGEVWVGDIGDNDRVRSAISLYRIPEVTRGDRTVAAERFDLVYPDEPRDAETLLVHPGTGDMFVVSKGTFGGEVFAVPEQLRADGQNTLRAVGSAGGLVTDGTFLPDGRAVVLRDYWDAFVVDPATWESRGSFPLPEQEQGEGLAHWPGDDRADGVGVLVSSEGSGAPLWSVAVPERLLPSPEASAGSGQPGRDGERGPTGGGEPTERRGSAGDEGTAPTAIPLGPAVTGGAVLVALTLGGFWLVRRRVRR